MPGWSSPRACTASTLRHGLPRRSRAADRLVQQIYAPVTSTRYQTCSALWCPQETCYPPSVPHRRTSTVVLGLRSGTGTPTKGQQEQNKGPHTGEAIALTLTATGRSCHRALYTLPKLPLPMSGPSVRPSIGTLLGGMFRRAAIACELNNQATMSPNHF